MTSTPAGQPVTPATRTSNSYYEDLGDNRYRSTLHAQGAWADDHQHMSPVAGLLVDALENCSPRPSLMFSRIAFDILGTIPGGEISVEAKVLRPGRTIELVQAEMIAGSRPVVRATGWRLETSDTRAIAASDLGSIPGPESAEPFDNNSVWPGGFIRSVELRRVGTPRPGSSTVWLRARVPLLSDRETSVLAGVFGLVDTANRVAVRVDPSEVLFPNTDLTVHLFRQPAGDWLGLQTQVSFGPDGIGLTEAVLHDLEGPFGRSAQTLTLRILPSRP